ncbi:MAG: hypothetical protein AAGA56_09150 [Myxococcota bacterium]
MPIVEHDPWRMQYFNDVDCPEDIFISTDDLDSYRLYPKHRWIYNKLLVAETQGLPCGPHGILPETYPVFSKPIYNLRGMGMETRVFPSEAEYLAERDPGHMWVELLRGDHLSSDLAVVAGEVQWWRHVQGKPGPHQTFDYWTVLAARRPDVEQFCEAWVKEHFADYTGMMNLETIGGRIIEGHLRFADQWPDLYGAGWLNALVGLYRDGRWNHADSDRRDGYSLVLFAAHGAVHRHPPPTLIEELQRTPGVSSIQITFHEDKAPELHAMPPGGFRVAVINAWDLEAGEQVRRRLGAWFFENRRLRPRRRRHVTVLAK